MPRILVTRPEPQAAAWVERLRVRGIDAVAVPLLVIEPALDAAPVQAAWARWPSFALVVFVSPNAVRHFFALRPATATPLPPLPPGLRLAGPGPGTAEALRELGIDASRIVEPDAAALQFDSEALWQQLVASDWRGTRVLVVRGDGGREWLSDRLAEAGAEVEAVSAYRRGAPQPEGEVRERLDAALAAPAAHVWLFSSAEAVGHLERLVDDDGPRAWAAARAVATHPRIAARAEAAGFGTVVEAPPSLEGVVGCIQSMRP